ncbi:MAG: hypothetical protein ABW022_11735 [Actinoplanes sp.]
MLTRAVSAVLLLVLVAGCANNAGDQAGGAPEPASAAPSDVVDLPLPSTAPSTGASAGKPAATGAQTLTGMVSAGVEPNCLVLTADGAAYQLVFDDPAMRADAPAGKKVTVTGRSEPSMMSTCQQGVPFIVTAVRAA